MFPLNETSLYRSETQKEENALVTSSADHSIRLWWKVFHEFGIFFSIHSDLFVFHTFDLVELSLAPYLVQDRLGYAPPGFIQDGALYLQEFLPEILIVLF